MSHDAHHPEDKGAAYMGLVAGLVSLFVICYAIVLFTNKQFEGHSAGARPAATAPASH